MGRDNGPIALVLGNKGRSEALSWLPRNVLQTQRKSTLEDFESVIINSSLKNAALRRRRRSSEVGHVPLDVGR